MKFNENNLCKLIQAKRILFLFIIISFINGILTQNNPLEEIFSGVFVDKIKCFDNKNSLTQHSEMKIMCDIKNEKVYQIMSESINKYTTKTLNGIQNIDKYKLSPCAVFCKISEAVTWVEQNAPKFSKKEIISIIVNSGIYSEIIKITVPIILRSNKNIKDPQNRPVLNGINSKCIFHVNSDWVEINGFSITGNNLYGICINNNINEFKLLNNDFDEIVMSPIKAIGFNTYKENWYLINNKFSNWMNQNIFAIRISNINNFYFENNKILGLKDMKSINGLYTECVTNATFIKNTIENLSGDAIKIVNKKSCKNPSFYIEIKENTLVETEVGVKIILDNVSNKITKLSVHKNSIKDLNEFGKEKENFIIEISSFNNLELDIYKNFINSFILKNSLSDNFIQSKIIPLNIRIYFLNNIFKNLYIFHKCHSTYKLDVHNSNNNEELKNHANIKETKVLIKRNTMDLTVLDYKKYQVQKELEKYEGDSNFICYYPKTSIVENNIINIQIIKPPIINNLLESTELDYNTKESSEKLLFESKPQVYQNENNYFKTNFNESIDVYCNYGLDNWASDYDVISEYEININYLNLSEYNITTSYNDEFENNTNTHNITVKCWEAKAVYKYHNCLKLANCSNNGICTLLNGSYFNGTYFCNCTFPFGGKYCNITTISNLKNAAEKLIWIFILLLIVISVFFILVGIPSFQTPSSNSFEIGDELIIKSHSKKKKW